MRGKYNEGERNMMSTRIEKDVDALKKDIERFRAHLGSTLSDAGTLSHDKVLQTKERLKAAMQGFEGTAVKEIGHANEVIHDQGERALRASREMVVRRPFTTVVVSFAAGLVTAFLLDKHH